MHISVTLRAVDEYKHSNRLVIADSYFASVNTALALKRNGLYFVGPVKTNTKKFPRTYFDVKSGVMKRGDTKFLECETEGTHLLAFRWKDITMKDFISRYGSNGRNCEYHEKFRYIGDEKKIMRVQKSSSCNEYFENFHIIDVHNHYRQSGLNLEQAWRTRNWRHRILATVLGIIEVDTYLLMSQDHPHLRHKDFTLQLVHDLTHNNFFSEERVSQRQRINDENTNPIDITAHRNISIKSIPGVRSTNACNKMRASCMICRKQTYHCCNGCSSRNSIHGICIPKGFHGEETCLKQHLKLLLRSQDKRQRTEE